MCDIYNAKCKICGASIQMHLGDYATPREDIDVYCSECRFEDTDCLEEDGSYFRDMAKDGVLWRYTTECVIVPKTELARENIGMNHPNAGDAKMIGCFGKDFPDESSCDLSMPYDAFNKDMMDDGYYPPYYYPSQFDGLD